MGWINTSVSNLLGRQAESKAADYLKQQGLQLLCQNYHCRSGEIDLVMQDQQELVFVEVKYRSSSHFGGAAEYFHAAKRKKFESAVQHYLLERGLNPMIVAHRIDLLAIDKENIQWLKHL